MLRVLIAAVIAFGIDRVSKIIIVERMDLASLQVLPVWPPYLQFVMAWNKGINFGLLVAFDARWLLVVFSVAISLALALWARNKAGRVVPLTSGALIGGALGNAYDRVVYGAVADYLNVSCCGIHNPYSFNVADVLIFGAAAVLIGCNEMHGKRAAQGSHGNAK
jgi:signal peptidase II